MFTGVSRKIGRKYGKLVSFSIMLAAFGLVACTPVQPVDSGAAASTNEGSTPLTDNVAPVADSIDTPPVVEQWDWLEFVVEEDVRQQIAEGLVVVMMHRFDCEVCEEMAPRYSEYYQQLVDQSAAEFKIAFLAIPPFGDEDHVPDDTLCANGQLTDEQKWELMSPYVVALLDGELIKTWEQGAAPEPEMILEEVFGE